MPVPAVHLIFFGFDLARVKVKVCTKIFLVDCISRAFLARGWTLFQDMHISI
jgi:hypothetical protein